jgi:hypothetical protein
VKVAARAEQPPSTSVAWSLPPWSWLLLWLGVAVATARLVRLPGPATLDPDEHAAALYFDRMVAGQRLEDPLLSAPKPLLTLVHGLAWTVAHDWRLLEALTVAAFALAVVCLARAAGRLAGWPAAAAAVVAVAGSGPLVLQAARGNSLVFALAGWSLALDALTATPGSPAAPGARGSGPAGTGGALAARGSGPAGTGALAANRTWWGLAALALALASLARVEGWLLLPLAAAYGAVAWRRGDRRAAVLLLPLAVPLLWLAHDWLLTGDPLYAVGVPERYTDLVAGREPVAPASWLAQVGRRYAADPLLLTLAVGGAAWLARRRAWVWLAGLGAASLGVLTLLGFEAWRGTYVSWRYFDPADLAVRLAAAIAAARLAAAAVRLAVARPRLATAPARPGVAGPRLATAPARPGAARHATPAVRAVPGQTRVGAVVGAALLVGAACWPLAPWDPAVDSTLDRDTRLSANAATAARALRPLAAEPGTVLAVSGPQRVRVALELGLPLGRVRDLFLAARAQPLDRALAGTAAVFHDADGDRPAERFAPLSATTPTTVGTVELVPLRTDPGRGLYVHRVGDARGG